MNVHTYASLSIVCSVVQKVKGGFFIVFSMVLMLIVVTVTT